MICCDTSALKTWCDLIVMKHTAKRNCAEYLDVMLEHRLFFFVKTSKTTEVYCTVIIWSITSQTNMPINASKTNNFYNATAYCETRADNMLS